MDVWCQVKTFKSQQANRLNLSLVGSDCTDQSQRDELASWLFCLKLKMMIQVQSGIVFTALSENKTGTKGANLQV